jgi:peptidoglycan/xylan/chitin deacetylase (PgdA/CDA1 family)
MPIPNIPSSGSLSDETNSIFKDLYGGVESSRRRNVPSYQTIATMDDQTNWGAASIAQGAGGTSVFKPLGGPFGAGSFEWTSPSETNSSRRDYTAAFKTSGGIGIWIKDTNNFNVPNKILVFVSDAGFTSYMVASMAISYNGFSPNGYQFLWIPAAQFDIGAGTPVFEGTTWAKLRINVTCGSGGANGILSTGPIVTCATGTGALAPKARIALTFDDANISDYTVALPLLSQYGLKATSYIIPAAIGTAGLLSIPIIKNMDNAGWDIAGHDLSSNTWTTANDFEGQRQTPEQVLARIGAVQAYLLSNTSGRGAFHMAYPGGGFDDASIAAMSELGVRSATRTGPPPTIPYSTNRPLLIAQQKNMDDSRYTLPRCYIQNSSSTTGAMARGLLTAIIDGKCDAILGFHSLSGALGSGIDWSIAEFTDFITAPVTGLAARVAAGQVECLTISEMFP